MYYGSGTIEQTVSQ